jgi:rhodanese-related sulfurtransferase
MHRRCYIERYIYRDNGSWSPFCFEELTSKGIRLLALRFLKAVPAHDPLDRLLRLIAILLWRSAMNRLDYFKARLDATIAPVDLLTKLKINPERICVVDVRNGPAHLLKDRIPTARQIPQNMILDQVDQLPRDREIVLYCWDTWCSLAGQAAVPLLEHRLDVREMYGGIKAWKTLRFPTEPVDAGALANQVEPLPV